MKITAHWQTRIEKGPDVLVPTEVSMGFVSKKGKVNMAKMTRIISNAQFMAMNGNVVKLIIDIQPSPSTEPDAHHN